MKETVLSCFSETSGTWLNEVSPFQGGFGRCGGAVKVIQKNWRIHLKQHPSENKTAIQENAFKTKKKNAEYI